MLVRYTVVSIFTIFYLSLQCFSMSDQPVPPYTKYTEFHSDGDEGIKDGDSACATLYKPSAEVVESYECLEVGLRTIACQCIDNQPDHLLTHDPRGSARVSSRRRPQPNGGGINKYIYWYRIICNPTKYFVSCTPDNYKYVSSYYKSVNFRKCECWPLANEGPGEGSAMQVQEDPEHAETEVEESVRRKQATVDYMTVLDKNLKESCTPPLGIADAVRMLVESGVGKLNAIWPNIRAIGWSQDGITTTWPKIASRILIREKGPTGVVVRESPKYDDFWVAFDDMQPHRTYQFCIEKQQTEHILLNMGFAIKDVLWSDNDSSGTSSAIGLKKDEDQTRRIVTHDGIVTDLPDHVHEAFKSLPSQTNHGQSSEQTVTAHQATHA